MEATLSKFKAINNESGKYLEISFDIRADLNKPELSRFGVDIERIETGIDGTTECIGIPLTTQRFNLSLGDNSANIFRFRFSRIRFKKVIKYPLKLNEDILPILKIKVKVPCDSDIWNWIYHNWGKTVKLNLECTTDVDEEGLYKPILTEE